MKKILDFTVKENRRLNADNFLLVLHSIELPEIQAGQFVNVRVDHSPSTFYAGRYPCMMWIRNKACFIF